MLSGRAVRRNLVEVSHDCGVLLRGGDLMNRIGVLWFDDLVGRAEYLAKEPLVLEYEV